MHVKFLIFHSLLSALRCGKYLQRRCNVSHVSFAVSPCLAEIASPCTVGAVWWGVPLPPPSGRNVLLAAPNSCALRADPQIWGKSCWEYRQGPVTAFVDLVEIVVWYILSDAA